MRYESKANVEEKTRGAIEQIARYLRKNEAVKTAIELLLPKRLHTAFKRVLAEFSGKE